MSHSLAQCHIHNVPQTSRLLTSCLFREAQKFFQDTKWCPGFCSGIWYKNNNTKKRKLLPHGTFKDWTKFTTQTNEKQKKKIKFFLSKKKLDNFVLP